MCVFLLLEFLALLALLGVLLGGTLVVWMYVSVFGVLVCGLFAGLALSPQRTAWVTVRFLAVAIPIGILAYVAFVLVTILTS